MRVLLIEDDEETIEDFVAELEPSGIEISVATSKASAEALLVGDLQLVVCDLKIPSQDGLQNAVVNHGLSVLAKLREDWSGVPVLGFSAHGTTPGLVQQLLALGGIEDFLGVGTREPLLNFFDKSELSECLAKIQRIKSGFDQLRAIEISQGVSRLEMTPEQARAIRIFARRRGAQVARVSRLGGGLSGAVVLRVRLEGPSGERMARVVAKLGPIPLVVDESTRYQQLISGTLGLGVCPAIIDTVIAGASQCGGLFYELAGEYPSTLLESIGQPEAGSVVARLEEHTSPWRDGAPTARVKVDEVRRSLIDDTTFFDAAGDELDWKRVERIESLDLQSRCCTQHGDLHGLNVLVSNVGEPLLIDFGETARMSAAVDPVTLELSPVFHPDSPVRDQGWPSVDQATRWHDLDAYIDNSPIADYVRRCREWTYDPGTSAGDREVASVVYAYAARQLKHPRTNRDLAVALIEGAFDLLER